MSPKQAAEGQRCKRCVMDTTDPDITFDERGFCNNCINYFNITARLDGQRRPIDRVFTEIKQRTPTGSSAKGYDALLGISGGTDSSYVAYLASTYRLNVLLVHLDDGWDTPEAAINVRRIAEQTGYDLEIAEAPAREFNDLLLAFLKSSALAIELPTDQAARAVVYRAARRFEIKTVLTGQNWVTEGILPKAWGHRNTDLTLLKHVHRKWGTVKLRDYPILGLTRLLWWEMRGKVKTYPLLNLAKIDYVRDKAIQTLKREWRWRDYGGKHGENRFTRFAERYIEPTKFGVDKRLAHYSTMICSGQMSRRIALDRLQHSRPYSSRATYQADRQFLLKKLHISDSAFDRIMRSPIVPVASYGTDDRYYRWLKRMKWMKGG